MPVRPARLPAGLLQPTTCCSSTRPRRACRARRASRRLQAEGVDVVGLTAGRLLHTYPIFQEAKWWHHLPAVPDKVPGCDEANRTAITLPYFTSDGARTGGPVRQGVREGLGAPEGVGITAVATRRWQTASDGTRQMSRPTTITWLSRWRRNNDEP